MYSTKVARYHYYLIYQYLFLFYKIYISDMGGFRYVILLSLFGEFVNHTNSRESVSDTLVILLNSIKL